MRNGLKDPDFGLPPNHEKKDTKPQNGVVCQSIQHCQKVGILDENGYPAPTLSDRGLEHIWTPVQSDTACGVQKVLKIGEEDI